MTGTSYVNYFEIMTNMKFNEYNRPNLQYRWFLSAQPADSAFSGNYWQGTIFYDQSMGAGYNHTVSSYGISSNDNPKWSFNGRWGNVGDNYLKISFSSTSIINNLNVNIR